MVKDVQQAVPGYGSQVRRPLNRDVGIKESALKMTKRIINGKLSTGDARKAALPLEKPLFFAYNHSMATKRAKNARKTGEYGPYGPVFAISRTFSETIDLTGPKTAKISNNGLQATTHKLSAMHTAFLATQLFGTVRGSRLNPDVQNRDMKK